MTKPFTHHLLRAVWFIALVGACSTPANRVNERDAGTDVDVDSDSAGDVGSLSCPGSGQQKSAFFNRRPPDVGKSQFLEDVFIQMLDCASNDAQVRIAIYRMNRPLVVDAVERAIERGVDLRFLVDADNKNKNGELFAALKRLQSTLGDDLIICPNGCIGSNINHNKFMTISKLKDGSKNVVLQSSANLTDLQRGLHNNIVIIRNDDLLYAGYRAYFTDLRSNVKIKNYLHPVVGSTNTLMYPSPKSTGDIVVDVLRKMDCKSGGELRVAMSLFTKRRIAVAKQIVKMKNSGCDIQMVLRGDDEAPDPEVLETLTLGGVSFIQYRSTFDGWNVHSKYFVWSGRFDGSAQVRKIVFTGSHNWNLPALRTNDETILRIEDDEIFTAFRSDFRALVREAR